MSESTANDPTLSAKPIKHKGLPERQIYRQMDGLEISFGATKMNWRTISSEHGGGCGGFPPPYFIYLEISFETHNYCAERSQ